MFKGVLLHAMHTIACHAFKIYKEKTQSKAMHEETDAIRTNTFVQLRTGAQTIKSKLSKFCGLYEISGVMKHTEHEDKKMYANAPY